MPSLGITCDSCKTEHEEPNVRLARSTEEESALNASYQQVISRLDAAKKKTVRLVEKAIKDNAGLAIAREVEAVKAFMSMPNSLFPTYHQLLAAGLKMSGLDDIDDRRVSFESAAFPNIAKEIRFASLTVCETGCMHFGNTILILDENLFKTRTTFLKGNCLVLAKELGVTVDQKFPPGVRSTWENVHKLCVIKHGSEVDPLKTSLQSIQEMLEPDASHLFTFPIKDCVEANIFGGFPPKNVKKIIYTGDLDTSTAEGSDWHFLQKQVAREYPSIVCEAA